MTTKKEIIDFIDDGHVDGREYYFSDEDYYKLIQMIKYLKPRVKKIEWEYSNCVHYGERYIGNGYRIVYRNKKYDAYYPYRHTYDTLTEAKQVCQKHYEETILGALENDL
jgi:hypothetical protein